VPSNSFRNPNVGPKCNNGKRKELRHALYFVTFEEVEECVEVPGWD
jgi:hypothetical protein